MEHVGKNSTLKLRFVAALAACALAFGVAASVSDSAYAYDYSQGNWSDTYYSSFAYASNVSYTDAREKWNDSSAWNSCYSGAPHKVEVAATGWSWNVQFVGSPIYWWGPNTSDFMLNNVNECGYPRALLWFNNYVGYDTTITGVWSPDSIDW